MNIKTKVSVYNAMNRLTAEELKILATKYSELALKHRQDPVDFEYKELHAKALIYTQAYQNVKDTNRVRTIHYGSKGRCRIETC